MPSIVANGISLYYERAGSGPPLLLCNGTGATLATSGRLLDVFTSRFDLVAHDQRGLGRTEIPSPPYTMADYAADAIGLVDAIGWDRFRLVGISFGGMVAQELAVTWPERVERLALLCTSPGGAAGASYPLHELQRLPTDERMAIGTPAARHPLHVGVARRPSERPGSRRAAGRRSGGIEDRRPGPRRGGSARRPLPPRRRRSPRAGDLSDARRLGSLRRHRAARQRGGDRQRIAGSDRRLYDGGHAFFAQDATAFPEILDFLAAA